MSAFPTPHIDAEPCDFAPTVLMPGDPGRSEFIAKNFLSSARLVNNVRGVQGYTGKYRGTTITVMASGMGMPSMGIYSQELFTVFGVERIIRIGSAGGMSGDVGLRDIIAAMATCTDSAYASKFRLPGSFAPTADYPLLSLCEKTAEKLGLREKLHIGTVLTTDSFYPDPDFPDDNLIWRKMGVLAVEMETAALYMNAARFGKRALGLFTVSDHLLTGEALSAEDRRSSFTEMTELALETAVGKADN